MNKKWEERIHNGIMGFCYGYLIACILIIFLL